LPTGAIDAPDVTVAVGTITGTVSDEDTSPISGAEVTLKNSVTVTRTTGSDGTFDFDDLETDTYTIEVRMAGYEHYLKTMTLAPGEDKVLSITLEQLKGSIKGKVVDDQGNPVEGALVELLDGNGNELTEITTGRNGEFNFRNLELGNYKIRISKEGFEAQTKDMELTQTAPDADAGTLTLRTPFPWWVIVVIVIVIVVLILIILLLFRRKRKIPVRAP
jgi:uncharacterized GH25 family protein